MDGSENFYHQVTPVIPRPEPMKVLVLGLPRTAICAALKVLGLKPYHFSEISRNKNNKHFQLWLKAVQAKYDGIGKSWQGEDFDRILWNYDAVSDDPCCLFVEELIAAYPDAKVILTVRPRAEWLRSMQKFILEILSWRSLPILCFLDREFMGPYIALLSRTTSVLSQGYIPNKSSAYPAFLESYDKHIDNVRRAVPEGKLLEFHPDQGWHSLCTFLNKPTPDGPYPHLNNSQDAMRKEHSLYWSRWCCVGETMAKTNKGLGYLSTYVRGFVDQRGFNCGVGSDTADANGIAQCAFSEAFDIGYESIMDFRKCGREELPADTYQFYGNNQWPSDVALPGFSKTHIQYWDYECITILAQGKVAGPEALNSKGDRVLAPPVEGTLVVNIADCLSTWSNKKFKSTIHRVSNRTGQERYSVALFIGVDYDVTVSVLENHVSSDRPACKAPFEAGEGLRSKLSRAYADYDDESASLQVADS